MSLEDLITAYRAAFERKDFEACDDIFASAGEEQVVALHRAIQEFDPVEPIKVDFMRAASRLTENGCDADTATFLASMLAGLPVMGE